MPHIKCRTTTKSCGWLKILLQFSYNFAVFLCYLWIKQSKSLTLDFMTDGLLVNYYYYEIAHIAMKSRCVGFPTMLIKKAVYMQISTGRPNSNVDASCPKGISLHVAAPSPRRRKNGERDSLSPFFLCRGEGAATQRPQRHFQTNQH